LLIAFEAIYRALVLFRIDRTSEVMSSIIFLLTSHRHAAARIEGYDKL
jgi:hypothetical protein